MKKFFVFAGFLVFCYLSMATGSASIVEETTVTATKTKVSTKEISKKVVVVTREEIEESGAETVTEILNKIPGIIVNSNGPTGSLSNVYLRGAKPGQTLVLVDGIEVSDTMGVDNSFDYSSLMAENIERIEVVYGSASVVYGSDAMAGVINIITVSENNGGFVKLEAGSYSTKTGAFSFQNSYNNMTYWIRGSYFDTDGISIASEKYGNTEEDGYENKSALFGLKYKLADSDLLFSGMVIDSNGDMDNSGGVGGDNPNFTYDKKNTFLKGEWSKSEVFGSNSLTKINITYSKTERNILDPDITLGDYNGEQYKVNWHNTKIVADNHNISFGVEYEKEKGDSYYKNVSAWGEFESIFNNKEISTSGVYFIDRITFSNGKTFEIGLRYEDNDMFGGKTTYQTGFVKDFENLGLNFKVNAGTSFKAPSLYQLFSDYGDENLNAEEADSYEIGFEKQLFGGSTFLSINYFYYSFDNMIDFDSTLFKYQNISKAELKGFDITVSYYSQFFNITANYSDYSTIDKETNEKWLRRPDNSFSLTMNFYYKNLSFNLNGVYNGKRNDLNFGTWPAESVVLDSFTVLNAKLNYKLNKSLSFYVKGRNVTDEDYELVYGYGTYGDIYCGGVVFTFGN